MFQCSSIRATIPFISQRSQQDSNKFRRPNSVFSVPLYTGSARDALNHVSCAFHSYVPNLGLTWAQFSTSFVTDTDCSCRTQCGEWSGGAQRGLSGTFVLLVAKMRALDQRRQNFVYNWQYVALDQTISACNYTYSTNRSIQLSLTSHQFL
jgi:hypothetical protein